MRGFRAFALLVAGSSSFTTGRALAAGDGGREADEARAYAGSGLFYERAEQGLEHFEAERYELAFGAFEAALAVRAGDPAERATIELNSAACEFALGRYTAAERRFLRVARAFPELGARARLNAGFAALFAGRLDAAGAHLAAVTSPEPALQARRVELSRRLAQAREAEQARRALPGRAASTARGPLRYYPLVAAGPSGLVLASFGYDDNAAQSGSSDELGIDSGESRVGSLFSGLQVEFAYAARLSERVAVQGYYSGDWAGLLEPRVQSLSYQSHELGGRTELALSRRARLRLTTAASYAVAGLGQLQPLLTELNLGGRLEISTGSHFRTRFELAMRPSFGLGENDHLDGFRADSGIAERARLGNFSAAASLGVRWLSIGEQRVALDPEAFAVCEPNCSAYRIPLSYLAPNAGLELGYDISSWLGVGFALRAEHRRYGDPSFIDGEPETRKKRRDLRWRVRAGIEAALDRASLVRLTLDESLVRNESNVDQASAASHDYADRNFQQSVTELGLLAMF
jgi:tetratricopeptide (TPR) repeat protein